MSLQQQVNAGGLPSQVPSQHSASAAVTIPVATETVFLTNTTTEIMAATPTIALLGFNAGTRITLLQTGSGSTMLTSGGAYGLSLGSPTRVLNQNMSIVLVFTGTSWAEESYSGVTASSAIPFNANIDDANISLLLHMSGLQNSTAFPDSGAYNYTVTATGGTTPFIDSSHVHFGQNNGLFQYAAGYLNVPVSTNPTPFTLGTGDFTIELWSYLNDWGLSGIDPTYSFGVINWGNGGVDGLNLVIYRYDLVFGSSGIGTVVNAPHGISLNTWNHIAVSRQGTAFRGFINGIQIGTTNYSAGSCYTPVTGNVLIGKGQNGVPSGVNWNYLGWMQDLCVTKGVAKYTSNFTPPVALLPAAYNPAYLPSSPVAGQLALSSYNLYGCVDAVGPVWKRTPLSST